MGLINKSKIREITELSISEEFEKELEKVTGELIKKAETRAKANQRRTLQARDL